MKKFIVRANLEEAGETAERGGVTMPSAQHAVGASGPLAPTIAEHVARVRVAMRNDEISIESAAPLC